MTFKSYFGGRGGPETGIKYGTAEKSGCSDDSLRYFESSREVETPENLAQSAATTLPKRKMSKKMSRIYGCCALSVILITTIVLIAVSLKKVKSTEYGLKYNVHSKILDDAAKTGGLYNGPPGFEFIKFPSTHVTADLPEETCVSRDGLLIQYQVSFQYHMPEEWVKPAVMKYRDFEKWATIVEASGVSAVQHTCSEFEVTRFQNQRGVIQNNMEENLRDKLEGKSRNGADGAFARAISLQLRNINLPEEYQDAVREKQAAAEAVELAKNQRVQERTKANTELLSAKEEARKIIATALNEANVTMTEARLKADEIKHSFEVEAAVLLRVKDSLGLTTEGVLAHMANRLYAEVETLKVSTGEPAKISRPDEL